jgi:hypothetical protein
LKQDNQHAFIVLNWRPYGYGDASAYVKPDTVGALSNIARLHFITPQADRIVTAYLPTNVATGAATGFASGAYGSQYVFHYGPYVAVLNLASTASSVTVPDIVGAISAYDWMTGTVYDLTKTRALPVPANGGILLTIGSTPADAATASALAF